MKFPINLYAIRNRKDQFLSNETGNRFWAKEADQIKLYQDFEEVMRDCELLNNSGYDTFTKRFAPYYVSSLTLELNEVLV